MTAGTLCDSGNALAALSELLLASHRPVNIVDAPRTRKLDTISFLQSRGNAQGDTEYVVPMPVPAAPRHVHNPGLGSVLHQFVGQVAAASEFGTAAIAANADAQAQATVRDSYDGFLVRQRLRMPTGHRRGGVKALESVM